MRRLLSAGRGHDRRRGVETQDQSSPRMRVHEERTVDFLTLVFVNLHERFVRLHRAQTMTEYALILAAVTIAVYGAYRVLGNSIGSLASGVDSTLTNA
jgi:Flp pilus assembly pilin Flp